MKVKINYDDFVRLLSQDFGMEGIAGNGNLKETKKIVDTVFNMLESLLRAGCDVSISRFGRFGTTYRDKRVINGFAADGVSRENLTVKERLNLQFKPSSILEKRVNENIDAIKQRRNIQVDSMGRTVADDAQDQEATAETTPLATTKMSLLATTKMSLTPKTKAATSKKTAKKSKTSSATKIKKVTKDKTGKHPKKSK